MSASFKYSVRNIIKISLMVLVVNAFGLTTQYMLDHNASDKKVSVATYAHSLIKGKVLPAVFIIIDKFHK